jgi:acetyl esterase/lipase
MRPSKPTTLNGRFWRRLPTLSAMATSISWGGSAGGTLALWCALDPTTGAVMGWDETARAHIKAVVSFSGPTNFCDWSNPGNIPPDALTKFEDDLDNYVKLPSQTDCDHDPNQNLAHASPYWLVTNGATSNPPPIMLYSTQGDPVPYSQADDMFNALITRYGGTVEVHEYRMNYPYGDPHDHAFKYWHAINNDPNSDGQCVSQEVINFLQTHQ